MARHLNRLTAIAVNQLTDVGRHADGGNLYLSISPNGGRRWVFLYPPLTQSAKISIAPVKGSDSSREAILNF
jgi:hypothetical protein